MGGRKGTQPLTQEIPRPIHVSTRFIWETIEEGITDADVESQVVVEWRIPDVGLIPGLYRVRILLTLT